MMIKNFLKLLFFCFFVIANSACQKWVADYLPQRPDKGFKMDEDASQDFKQGWNDGCETGMSAGSNTFYKMFYRSNAVDGYKITSSAEYKTAWNNAYWYCYRKDYIKQKSAIWSSYFVGYQ